MFFTKLNKINEEYFYSGDLQLPTLITCHCQKCIQSTQQIYFSAEKQKILNNTEVKPEKSKVKQKTSITLFEKVWGALIFF